MGRTSCGTGKRFVMCPRYCEIFGPGACAGVFDEKECVMRKKKERVKKLEGWGEICALVGWSRPTLIKHGFPVYQISRGSRVFAYADELRKYKISLERRTIRDQAHTA